jgi:hypothetical protein
MKQRRKDIASWDGSRAIHGEIIFAETCVDGYWMKMIMKMTMFHLMILKMMQMIIRMFDGTITSYCLSCYYPTNFYNMNNMCIVSVLCRH